MVVPILVVVLSYLVGSIPFGFLIARWHGIDIRTAGSGNIGATNVVRVLGKRVGAAVFVLDFLKGALPTIVAGSIGTEAWLPIVAGLTAVLGHMFPVWLGFRGGKGVATGAGVVSVLFPLATLGALLVWAVFFCVLRYVSLASVVAAAVLVGLHMLITAEPFAGGGRIKTGFCLLAFLLVLVRHRDNLSRLARGHENQFAESPAMNTFTRVLHVFALSLWFGSGMFFTFVVALQIFGTLEHLGEQPPESRPAWLPLLANFDKAAGTRLAGETISPIFARYFAIQGLCGIAALVTALGFSRAEPGRRVHRVRFALIALAVLTLLATWPLNQHISELRIKRNEGDPAAKAQFGTWHTASLLLNFGTLGLVTVATGMLAALPAPFEKKAR
ncbi:MAG: glycerol-3-phosphate 1-O-acyltransferase PlsY [Gemmataceae bacterium]